MRPAPPANLFAALPNLFAALPGDASAEAVERLAGAPGPGLSGLVIERIVSRGQASPAGFWYDQEQTEWVALLAGTARLEFADGTACDLRPGDWLELAPHRRHRVAATSAEPPAVWLAVHWRTS